MKTFLTTAIVAFAALLFSTTTQAEHYHNQEDASKLTSCDLLKEYRNNPQAVKGSYLEVNCDFGFWNNEVTVTTDSIKIVDEHPEDMGEYCFKLDEKYPIGNVVLHYQKIAGDYSPNWITGHGHDGDSNHFNCYDMNDHYVHTEKDHFYSDQIYFYSDFGHWDTGADEKIAIYVSK